MFGVYKYAAELRRRRRSMKVKRLLKFYFCADGLNGALDNIILRFAVRSGEVCGSCEVYAEKIEKVISEKEQLGRLWAFLNGAFEKLGERDIRTLKEYALSRKPLSEIGKTEVKRAVTKFSRRVKAGIDRFSASVGIVNEYYCLLTQ